jgi:hypothetical protein
MGMPAPEQNGIRPKKPRRRTRGRARASLYLIEAARDYLSEAWPTTVRGVCYALFVRGVIPSMAQNETKRVSRLLVAAREEGSIPWAWIVDETREIERRPSWDDAEEYVQVVRRAYRRDFWAEQPRRVLLVSEKGTVRGVVRPVLDELGVGFLPVGGFAGATTVHDLADDDDGRPLIVLYVGDHDPSGLYMSERDLPARIERYGGSHVEVRRIALLAGDLADLPSFSAGSKRRDSRYRWYVERYGATCWELDAMHPNTLRDRVADAVTAEIEPEAWTRCETAQEAEQEALTALLDGWAGAR